MMSLNNYCEVSLEDEYGLYLLLNYIIQCINFAPQRIYDLIWF